MERVSSHIIAEKANNWFKYFCEENSKNGDILVREITGRDYGVDLVVERFKSGQPTGIIAFIQIKGTEKELPKKGTNVSCPDVSLSSLKYAKQNRVAMFLVYTFIKHKKFFFLRLQDIDIDGYLDKASNDKNNKTSIPIPLVNNSGDKLADFFNLIELDS